MRYGSIRYVNNLPVDHGLVSGATGRPASLKVLEGTPTELNHAIDTGTVDVGAVSAARLLSPHGGLSVLPEATIASHGPVDSVLLVSKRPVETLDQARIAVSKESATGALLLRILLERDAGVTPTYHTQPSVLDDMLADHDAALLIGDDALRASAGIDAHGHETDTLDGLHLLDLGEAWRAYTGHPMVYALWVARPDLHVPDLDHFRHSLAASRAWGARHLDSLVDVATARTNVPADVIRTYYGRLTYTLGDAELAGLRRFADEAAKLDGSPGAPIASLPPVLEMIA